MHVVVGDWIVLSVSRASASDNCLRTKTLRNRDVSDPVCARPGARRNQRSPHAVDDS